MDMRLECIRWFSELELKVTAPAYRATLERCGAWARLHAALDQRRGGCSRLCSQHSR